MSDFWSDPSSTSILHVYSGGLRGCAGSLAPSLVAYVISAIISIAGSNVVLNQSSVLLLNRIVHWALSLRCAMTRMMIVLMYFLILAYKASSNVNGRNL